MIIVRSPLRISLGGGGTDLPSYYKKENGFVLSAAINKYVYVTITRPFSKGIYLKYSEIEKVTDPKNIHPMVYNEITESFEIHPKVRNSYKNVINQEEGTLTFETQVLGQFSLAETQ